MKGSKIGEIDHLIIDKISGRVTYAVMSFGGFLGLGHSHYPLPWGALKYNTRLEGYETGVTEAQLKDAPAFSDDFWASTGTGKSKRIHTTTCTRIGDVIGNWSQKKGPLALIEGPFCTFRWR